MTFPENYCVFFVQIFAEFIVERNNSNTAGLVRIVESVIIEQFCIEQSSASGLFSSLNYLYILLLFRTKDL